MLAEGHPAAWKRSNTLETFTEVRVQKLLYIIIVHQGLPLKCVAFGGPKPNENAGLVSFSDYIIASQQTGELRGHTWLHWRKYGRASPTPQFPIRT